MKNISAFSLIFGNYLLIAGLAHAVDFPLSQYGQIQNVQSYSSNPFYNPDSPYNKRMPTPIYAQGTELNAGECLVVVDSIIAQQCSLRNNCASTSYSDIRPAIIMGLSSLTGHNYVTSCNGYIQGAFDDYIKSASVTTPSMFPSAFPMGGVATQKSTSELVLGNPFEQKKPDWQNDRTARQNEMRELQRQNGSDDVALEATKFPTTYADLSFTERMANDKAGYEPWKDASGYKVITIESDEKRYTRETDIATQQAELVRKQKELLELTDQCAWCLQYKTECYPKLQAQLETLNKGRKESACAAKEYGEPTSYKEWAVVEDKNCGWILKDNAKTINLDDMACGKSDPNYGLLANCPKDDKGEEGLSGETKPCKTDDGKDGTRLCTDGVWGICTEGILEDGNGEENEEEDDEGFIIKIQPL